jgi:biotin carboxyl carrier protein
MALEFGLLMTLIGVISVFSSLAVVAFTCVVLKKFSRQEVTQPAVPTGEEKVEAAKAEAGTFKIKLDGEEHEVKVEDLGVGGTDSEEIILPHEIGEEVKVVVGESEYKIKIEEVSRKPLPIVKKPVRIREEIIKEAKNVIKAPMPGTVVKIPVKVGDTVEKETVILILETMKMENTIKSPVSGVIKAIRVSEGDSVNTNDLLIVID